MKAGKFISVVILSMAVIFMPSCKKPKATAAKNPPAFTLQFKAKYGSQSFALNSGGNIDPSGRYIVASTLMYYLSHINLIKTDGSNVKVSDLAIVDFADTATLSISIDTLQGNFTGISFGCGVDSIQNLANPGDSIFPNPYSDQWNTYWYMMGYRFQVLEGKWDTANIPLLRNAIAYHTGTDTAYRQTQLSKNFSVCCNAPYTLTLTLDVEQIFYNTATGQNIDIATWPGTSVGSLDNPAILPAFVNNFCKSFTLSN